MDLLREIQTRIKPMYHIFGHIHGLVAGGVAKLIGAMLTKLPCILRRSLREEGYGLTTDGQTVFVNASTCTLRYRPTNAPLVFDVPLPPAAEDEN